jgi:hypothetical protein
MEDRDISVTSPEEWRERNRGFMFALSACLALWVGVLWLIVRT